ncbi:MAG: elongation factor-1 alpha [Gallionellaceae bacterium]
MKPLRSHMVWLNLPNMPTPIKVLFSGYLLVIGLGLAMAGLQIMLTHGMADGKMGLSVDDIVYSYYGDRSASKLEAKLNGSMKGMGTPEARLEIIKWVRNGSPEAEWDSHMKATFSDNCASCHGVIPGLPDFNKIEAAKALAKVDEGASIQSLTRVSHIHLFGISFIFFMMGFIFSFSIGVPRWVKIIVIFFPFAFLILDILSWWLTKFSPHFAWLTIIGGIGYSLASSFMWVVSMYEMFVLSRTGKVYGNAWEADMKAWGIDLDKPREEA